MFCMYSLLRCRRCGSRKAMASSAVGVVAFSRFLMCSTSSSKSAVRLRVCVGRSLFSLLATMAGPSRDRLDMFCLFQDIA